MREDPRRTAGPLVVARSSGISIHVEQHVKDKMQGWCNAANCEVSGLFLVRLKDSIFYVYDVFLPEQQGSSGYTKIDGYAAGRLYSHLQRRYGFEGMGDLKGWWHTHYNFNTFWSGTDDDTAQSNAVAADDWGLSIVINQAGDWLGRVDVVKPIPIMVDQLPIKFVPNKAPHAKRNYVRDIARWVKPFPQILRVKKKAPVILHERTQIVLPDEPKYINYGGQNIPTELFRTLVDCPCGSMDCIDCSDALRQLKKVTNA